MGEFISKYLYLKVTEKKSKKNHQVNDDIRVFPKPKSPVSFGPKFVQNLLRIWVRKIFAAMGIQLLSEKNKTPKV